MAPPASEGCARLGRPGSCRQPGARPAQPPPARSAGQAGVPRAQRNARLHPPRARSGGPRLCTRARPHLPAAGSGAGASPLRRSAAPGRGLCFPAARDGRKATTSCHKSRTLKTLRPQRAGRKTSLYSFVLNSSITTSHQNLRQMLRLKTTYNNKHEASCSGCPLDCLRENFYWDNRFSPRKFYP